MDYKQLYLEDKRAKISRAIEGFLSFNVLKPDTYEFVYRGDKKLCKSKNREMLVEKCLAKFYRFPRKKEVVDYLSSLKVCGLCGVLGHSTPIKFASVAQSGCLAFPEDYVEKFKDNSDHEFYHSAFLYGLGFENVLVPVIYGTTTDRPGQNIRIDKIWSYKEFFEQCSVVKKAIEITLLSNSFLLKLAGQCYGGRIITTGSWEGISHFSFVWDSEGFLSKVTKVCRYCKGYAHDFCCCKKLEQLVCGKCGEKGHSPAVCKALFNSKGKVVKKHTEKFRRKEGPYGLCDCPKNY